MTINNVVFIVASKDYQPIEYQIPKHLIEQAGYHVITASDEAGTIVASDGTQNSAEINLTQIDIGTTQALVLIGGGGALEHLDNQLVYNLLKKASDAHLVIGAICIATRILAQAGSLA